MQPAARREWTLLDARDVLVAFALVIALGTGVLEAWGGGRVALALTAAFAVVTGLASARVRRFTERAGAWAGVVLALAGVHAVLALDVVPPALTPAIAAAAVGVTLPLFPVAFDRARRRGVPGTMGVGAALALAWLAVVPASGLVVAGALVVAAAPPAAPPERGLFHARSGSGHRALSSAITLYLALTLAAPWTVGTVALTAFLAHVGVLLGFAVHAWRPARHAAAWPFAFTPLVVVLADAFLTGRLGVGVPLALVPFAFAAFTDALAGAFTAEARRTGGRVPKHWIALALVLVALLAWDGTATRFLAAALFVPGALLARETRTRPDVAPSFTGSAAAVLVLIAVAGLARLFLVAGPG